MRLSAVFLCLLLAPMAASADWVLVNKSDKADIYVDSSSIRKVDQIGRVWTLFNWNSMQKGGYLSVRSSEEFDCKNELWRSIFVTYHQKPFADGELLPAPFATSQSWFPVPPQTTISMLFTLACSK